MDLGAVAAAGRGGPRAARHGRSRVRLGPVRARASGNPSRSAVRPTLPDRRRIFRHRVLRFVPDDAARPAQVRVARRRRPRLEAAPVGRRRGRRRRRRPAARLEADAAVSAELARRSRRVGRGGRPRGPRRFDDRRRAGEDRLFVHGDAREGPDGRDRLRAGAASVPREAVGAARLRAPRREGRPGGDAAPGRLVEPLHQLPLPRRDRQTPRRLREGVSRVERRRLRLLHAPRDLDPRVRTPVRRRATQRDGRRAAARLRPRKSRGLAAEAAASDFRRSIRTKDARSGLAHARARRRRAARRRRRRRGFRAKPRRVAALLDSRRAAPPRVFGRRRVLSGRRRGGAGGRRRVPPRRDYKRRFRAAPRPPRDDRGGRCAWPSRMRATLCAAWRS